MELVFRPLTDYEQKYCFTPHAEVGKRCGLIGHLRMDFGSSGRQFYTTFFDFKESRKTPEFRADLDCVINALREDGNILYSLPAMQKYCWNHPEAELNARYRAGSYGIRIDTEEYSFVLRLWPEKGDYNLYCMCYKKTMLDRYIRAAFKGIRFLNEKGETIFTLPDGDRIKIVFPEGGSNRDTVISCRYLSQKKFLYDKYRDGKIFTPEEFAKYAASLGWTVTPNT